MEAPSRQAAQPTGPKATLTEWMAFEQQCSSDGVDFAPLLEAWLLSLDADCYIWDHRWSEAAVLFVRRHLDSKLTVLC